MKALAHFLFIVSLLLGTGCASIVSQSRWTVNIDSEPPGAHVEVTDRNGKPVYQGIDVSFLVATLTAAIQELKAINDTQAETINALTARIVALENR